MPTWETRLVKNSESFLMNYIIRLSRNFTVAAYCQHIANSGKEGKLSYTGLSSKSASVKGAPWT